MIDGIECIDVHCHIYPDAIAERAVQGTGKFYDLPLKYGGTVSDLQDKMAKNGIDHAVVQSVATTPAQVKSINEFIARSVQNNPNLTGLGTLHPDSTDLKGDFAHLRELGLRGVKLHPDIQAFKIDDYRCLKIYEMCEEAGLPILMHCGDSRYDYSNPNRLAPVLKIYDKLVVVGAHFGGWSVWEQALETLPGFENLYVDCSSSFYNFTPAQSLEMIRRYGAEHVLFGTDYPMWDVTGELDYFRSLDLDENEKKCILNMNAKKIFSIGGNP